MCAKVGWNHFFAMLFFLWLTVPNFLSGLSPEEYAMAYMIVALKIYYKMDDSDEDCALVDRLASTGPFGTTLVSRI
jgi:hypothetical protein